MLFEIKPENNKTYILNSPTEQLGTLLYDGVFSQENAVIRLNKETNSKIEKTSFWGNEFIVKKGEIPAFLVKQNWNGNLDITTLNQEVNQKYTLKTKSFWKDTQVLVDENQNEILQLGSKYNWKSWNYDFIFNVTTHFQTLYNKELLLFALMHGLKKMKAAIIIIVLVIVMASANH